MEVSGYDNGYNEGGGEVSPETLRQIVYTFVGLFIIFFAWITRN